MNNHNVSLIICAYNEEKYIEACLDSAIKNSAGRFHEIIVVDNNSTDRTKEIAEKTPGVTVVKESEKGTSNARQKGFEVSTGDILAFIDADTHLTPAWFDKMMDFFVKNPKAVSLSGPYKYYDGSKLVNFAILSMWWIAPVIYHLVGYMVLGGNFVVRKKALEAIGGFDRSILFYGDDTDVARRLSKVGKVVFRMNFFIYSSSRRFMKEGVLKTSINYAMNFIWPVLFHRPFTKK